MGSDLIELIALKSYILGHDVRNIMEIYMAACPRCGTEVSKHTKEWDYANFHVRLFTCPKCEKTFKYYCKQGKLSHTIPKK